MHVCLCMTHTHAYICTHILTLHTAKRTTKRQLTQSNPPPFPPPHTRTGEKWDTDGANWLVVCRTHRNALALFRYATKFRSLLLLRRSLLIKVCQCHVGLFCSSLGLFFLYIRPVLTLVRTSASLTRASHNRARWAVAGPEEFGRV